MKKVVLQLNLKTESDNFLLHCNGLLIIAEIMITGSKCRFVRERMMYSGLSLSRKPSISNFSLSRTIFSVPFHWYQPNFLSLSRTLSISNKFLGPLRVRDRESPLYIHKQVFILPTKNKIKNLREKTSHKWYYLTVNYL